MTVSLASCTHAVSPSRNSDKAEFNVQLETYEVIAKTIFQAIKT